MDSELHDLGEFFRACLMVRILEAVTKANGGQPTPEEARAKGHMIFDQDGTLIVTWDGENVLQVNLRAGI